MTIQSLPGAAIPQPVASKTLFGASEKKAEQSTAESTADSFSADKGTEESTSDYAPGLKGAYQKVRDRVWLLASELQGWVPGPDKADKQ